MIGAEGPTLFDRSVHRSSAPMRNAETSIAFLDRVDWPAFDQIRAELDSWFASYPADERHGLRTRFRSSNARDHVAAWWELYLHALMTRLGYRVEVHPNVLGTNKRPDFRVTGPDGSFLLEAVTTRGGIVRDNDRHEVREARFLDAVNTIESLTFSLYVGEVVVGERDVPARIAKTVIGRWLRSLDPHDLFWNDPAGEKPTLFFEHDGWRVEFTAGRRGDWESPEARHRLIGAGPVVAGYVDTRSRLRTNLAEKSRRYGRPTEPYVIALLSERDGLDLEDIAGALFGSLAWAYDLEDASVGHWVRHSDGILRRGTARLGEHISGFLFASRLMPETFMRDLPDLFPNPDATRPAAIDGPFRRFRLDTDRMAIAPDREARATAADIFDLPTGWPGFDRH